MGYKEETRKTYEEHAEEFEEFAEQTKNLVQKEADIFIKHLKGKKILDLGSGTGIYAEYFAKKGFDIVCVDISEEMVKLCQKKGLKAQVMDLEKLEFTDQSFDGVWAYTSLLHIPKKNISNVIKKITNILKPQGILGLALVEGTGEGFIERFPGAKVWFSYFNDKEVRILFGEEFKVVYSKTENNGGFLNYILVKT